jgi:hypothetical protein
MLILILYKRKRKKLPAEQTFLFNSINNNQMEGVILFADDEIYNSGFEEDFFKSLVSEKQFPVIAVDNLELLQKTSNSISTFKAIILDWNFKDGNLDELGEEGLGLKTGVRNPDGYLLGNKLFSLIYIYSDEDVRETETGRRLIEEYGERIKFKIKNKSRSAKDEKNEIFKDIAEFENNNPNLKVPYIWGQSINKSVQRIFKELQVADPNWITELYKTASSDPVSPSIEVINLFQNLLAEQVIQDKELNDKIEEVANGGEAVDNAENFAKLIRILYYGKVETTSPLMTGDIIKLAEDQFGIIITPECDIRHVLNHLDGSYFELLCFSSNDFKKSEYDLKATIKATPLTTKAEEFAEKAFTGKQRMELSQLLNSQIKSAENNLHIEAFTQTNSKLHLLPCFEFVQGDFSGIAKIDFRTSLKMYKGSSITVGKRIAKINTPYIQELRQRYFAYKGRVGVPGHSKKLREWLLGRN